MKQNIPLPPLLEVKDLRVSFAGKEVVHGVDFAIGPGEKLALVGESGSGKTVTALSLVRLVHNARITGSAKLIFRIIRNGARKNSSSHAYGTSTAARSQRRESPPLMLGLVMCAAESC